MSEDRVQESSQNRDQESSEDRDQESSQDRDQESSQDRDQESSQDRDQESSEDRDQESSEGRDQDSSEDEDDGEDGGQDDREEVRDEDSPTNRRQDSSDGSSKRRTAAWAIAAVRSQFPDLSGQPLEQVTGVAKGEDSTWTVGVEVLEIRMVPDTADILAQYDVMVDQDGDIIGYRRIRRYLRGRADD